MKSLELNAYGVEEMSRQEMVETDGGIVPLLAIPVVVGAALLLSSCNNKVDVKVDVKVEVNPNTNIGNDQQNTKTTTDTTTKK